MLSAREALTAIMRILLVIALSPLLATFAPPARSSEAPPQPLTRLSFEPVQFDRSDPARRRAGRLVYLGGWAIRSRDARFGGISAMHVEGGQVIALSDAGAVIRFPLPGARSSRAAIVPLGDGPGSDASKRDRDIEALIVHKGKAWVVFERLNQVWRYAVPNWKSEASAAPPAMKDWPLNEGGEAAVRLGDGRFLLFAEGPVRADGTSAALLFEGDPAIAGSRAREFRYRPPSGYNITDAALLPDGSLLLLHRRFRMTEGVSAKLTLARSPVIGGRDAMSGVEIAHLQPPLAVDNMEALAVTREKGRTIVWIASDDNFNPLQRTILLKFALAD